MPGPDYKASASASATVSAKSRPRIILCVNAAWNIVNFRASLVRALIADGYDVVAVAPRDAFVDRLLAIGCGYRAMPMDNKGTSPIADMLLFLRVVALLAKLRPVAYLGYTIKPNVYGTLAARLVGVPAINNVSGLGTAFIKRNWITRVVTMLYRMAFAGTARVFFQNADDRDLFAAMGIVSGAKTALLPGSGVDTAHFVPRPRRPREGVVFLLVARMLRDKGVGEYIDAARIVRREHAHARFQLAGMLDVENRTAVTRPEIDAWVSEGTVEYLGALDDVRDALAQSDCVVLPSYREGAPRSLIEAAAMARATIATDVPGCRHVVEDGVTGLMCQVRDAADLARAMSRMIAMDEERRDAMGRAGRAMVEARFDDRLVIAAYREALAAVGVMPRPS